MSLKAKIFFGFLTSVALVVALAIFGVVSIGNLAARFETTKEQVVDTVTGDAKAIEHSSEIATLARAIDAPKTFAALEAAGFENRIAETFGAAEAMAVELLQVETNLAHLLEARLVFLYSKEALPADIAVLRSGLLDIGQEAELYFSEFEEAASHRSLLEVQALVREREQSKVAAEGVALELDRFPEYDEAELSIVELWTEVAALVEMDGSEALLPALELALSRVSSSKQSIEAENDGLYRKLKASFLALEKSLETIEVEMKAETLVSSSLDTELSVGVEPPVELSYTFDQNAAFAALRKLSRSVVKYGVSQRKDALEIAGLSLSSLFIRSTGGKSDSDSDEGLVQKLVSIKQAYSEIEIALNSIIAGCDQSLAYVGEDDVRRTFEGNLASSVSRVQELLGEIAEASVGFERGVEFSDSARRATESLIGQVAGAGGLATRFQELSRQHKQVEDARMTIVASLNGIQESTLARSRSLVSNLSTGLNEIIEEASGTKSTLIVVCVIAVVVSLLLGTLLPQMISAKLVAMSAKILGVTNELSVAADQVSSTSGSLASGASQQAASLEETNASLHEISARSVENARSAEKTASVTQLSRESAEAGVCEMKDLEIAMSGIQESSTEVSQIIKTIEDIAFQTNILALNAAVEAARAGEQGAGFAVVAEEVRSLAGRVSKAARETGGKIEHAIVRSKEGVTISQKAKMRLEQILSRIQEADTFVSGISSSTSSQSEGIRQISESMTHMDEVTQTAVGSAQMTADAAQDLNAQSSRLRETVDELNLILHGRERNRRQGEESKPSEAPVNFEDAAWELPARARVKSEADVDLWN